MQYFLKQFCCLSLIKLHTVQGVNNVQKCLITAFSSLTTKLGRCHPNVCTAETGSQLLTATSYTKIGTIQRRLAWPLRKDDTQNREAFHIFCDRNSFANPLCFGRRDWNLRLLSKMEKTRHFTTSMSSQRSRPGN
jgi:hypothetical protein